MHFRASISFLTVCCLTLAGCSCSSDPKPPENSAKPNKPTGVVRLLVIDDPPLAEAIEREWTALGGEIEVRNATSDEIAGLKKLSADAVVYPSGLLGEFAERELIVPVPEDVLADRKFARRVILPLARQHETSWGSQAYAVPVGSPQLVLFYRSDI